MFAERAYVQLYQRGRNNKSGKEFFHCFACHPCASVKSMGQCFKRCVCHYFDVDRRSEWKTACMLNVSALMCPILLWHADTLTLVSHARYFQLFLFPLSRNKSLKLQNHLSLVSYWELYHSVVESDCSDGVDWFPITASLTTSAVIQIIGLC